MDFAGKRLTLSQLLETGRRLEAAPDDTSAAAAALVDSAQVAGLILDALGAEVLAALNLAHVLGLAVQEAGGPWRLLAEVDVPVGDELVVLAALVELAPRGRAMRLALYNQDDELLAETDLWAAQSHRPSNVEAVALALWRAQQRLERP